LCPLSEKSKKNIPQYFFFASQLLFTRQIGSTNVDIFLLFFRDALITCIVNTLTCLTAGVLVFSILGYMAHLTGGTVQDVARSGPGLVFLTYPELVLSLPGSFIWAILFFAMLLVLGVDTAFCSVESLITGIVDNWSEQLQPHRKKVAFVICMCCFFLGLPMCTEGGMYLFQLMDFYAASGLSLLWICFF